MYDAIATSCKFVLSVSKQYHCLETLGQTLQCYKKKKLQIYI